MKKAERGSFRLMRWTGIVLTLLAWPAFLVSFFLPTAVQIGSMLGAPLELQSGWQTYVDTWQLSTAAARDEPFALLCVLSPWINGLMLLALPVNLMTRHYTVFFGVILCLTGTSAIWVCLQVYEGLNVGFYLWIGSILTTAMASFLISGRRERLRSDRRKFFAVLLRKVPGVQLARKRRLQTQSLGSRRIR